jgi:SNF2 family DNA or RNA helicase
MSGIVHLTVIPLSGSLLLWVEDTSISQRPRQGQRAKVTAHPFTLDQGSLQTALGELTPDFRESHLTRQGYATLMLPGARRHPQPSPLAEAAGIPVPLEPMELLAWEVDGVLLNVSQLLDFFGLLRPEAEMDGWLYGASIAYWREVTRFALRCLETGHYIPALAPNQGDTFIAYWEARPPRAALDALVGAMPREAHALANQYGQVVSPSEALRGFLTVFIDDQIREMVELDVLGSVIYRHTRWDQALVGRSDNGVLSLRGGSQFYQDWSNWAERSQPRPYRLCLRLDEPETDHGDWQLSYFLQSQQDVGTLIPLAELWAGGPDYEHVRQGMPTPRQQVLAWLYQAAQYVPAVDRSLNQRQPSYAVLSASEAHAFLYDGAAKLSEQDIIVLVPDWFTRTAKLKIKRNLFTIEDSLGLLRADTLFDFKWEVALGDTTIDREAFEEIVARKQPLVQVAGEWVALDEKQIRAAQAFFTDQPPDGEMNLFDALHATSKKSAGENYDGIEISALELDKQVHKLLNKLRKPAKAKKATPPKSLQATLRPYQEKGLGWLVQMRQSGLGACLADDMGLGKTIQTIALWLYEREKLAVTGPALLVCPTSVVGNWVHEAAKFGPALRVMAHHGPNRLSGDSFSDSIEEMDVVVTSYALLTRDQDDLLGVRWDSVTLDEAQNIKNPSTKQAQAARKLRARFKLALTGTPVENRLSELWSIFQFLNPGYLGSRQVFTSRFATPIERHNDKAAANQLRQLVAPFILRREKSDPKVIQDLPDKHENRVYCTLSTEQVALYEAIVRRELDVIAQADSEMTRRGAVLRMLVHLKQVCNHPAHYLKLDRLKGKSGKLDRLHDILDEIDSAGERLLLFTQYTKMGGLLHSFLARRYKRDVLFLHGGTPGTKRAEMVETFQQPDGPPAFILSLRAGGTGLNLTAASHVIHYDRWYNPAVEDQATDRAYRIGQDRTVQVHKLISIGTLEERIDELIERKKAIADQVVGSGEAWVSELSDGELRDLVALRANALGG